jgi:outer membrane murein-binding lipoprotein Lpp
VESDPGAVVQPTSPNETLFDRKFVVTAVILGAVFVAMAIIISKIDQNAGTVAGVFLAALAAALFKKFESLRFHQLAESSYHKVEIPRLHWWGFILAGVWCLFLILLIPTLMVFAMYFYKIQSVVNAPDFQAASAKLSLEVGVGVRHSILANVIATCGFLAGSFFFGVTCALVSSRRAAYTYAVFGALLAQAFPLLGVVITSVIARERPRIPAPSLAGQVLPLACIAAAFVGAYFTSRRREGSAKPNLDVRPIH